MKLFENQNSFLCSAWNKNLYTFTHENQDLEKISLDTSASAFCFYPEIKNENKEINNLLFCGFWDGKIKLFNFRKKKCNYLNR
jgi:hypothetical protein